MALYPPSPAPPVAGANSAKNEKLIFAPTADNTPLSSPAGQAAIAARAHRLAFRDDSERSSAAPSRAATPNSVVRQRAEQFLKHEHRGGLRRRDLDPRSPIAQFHAWFAAAKGTELVAHPETCTLATASLPSGRVSARMVYLKELDRRGFVIYSNFGTSRKAADLFGGDRPNPWAALTFWWEPLERQVRVEGRCERLSSEESQRYFDTRVRGSRIGAWASRQSAVLVPEKKADGEEKKTTKSNGEEASSSDDGEEDDGRAQLNRWVAEVEARFGPSKKGPQNGENGENGEEEDEDDDFIPVPEFWGGLRIVPERVEFWQGRQNRLHDRFVYDRVHKEGEEVGEAKEAKAEDDPETWEWTLQRLSP